MFLEAIRSEGLNHISYIIGDGGKAAVIDPRRDCRIYIDIAARNGLKITHIFETHRHEDFVLGSLELARQTKAKIYHGDSLHSKYGERTEEGDQYELGSVILRVLETPGHTPESISLTLSDRNFNLDNPVAIFTGDALLIGDTGRTDLYPALREELSGMLYDSLHEKILPVGDQAIIYPAHGENSLCANKTAARRFSTIGYERRHNPLLGKNRHDFIRHKLSEDHYLNPCFRHIEKLNRSGAQLVERLTGPTPENADDFAAALRKNNMIVLDVRSPEAFAGAHIPGSLSVPLNKLVSIAGWFLPLDKKIGLVAGSDDDIARTHNCLMRMGYDNLAHYLSGGISAWIMASHPIDSIPVVSISGLNRIADGNTLILDVRTHLNAQEKHVAQRWIRTGDLQQQLRSLPQDKKIITFCTTGREAIIAASILKKAKFSDVGVCLGSDKDYRPIQAA